MKIAILAGLVFATAGWQQAAAATTSFAFNGVVLGSEFGPAAASDIYAVAPVGSAYTLTFSYDAASVPTYSGPTYGSYANVPVNAVFAVGGSSFAIPTAYLNVGSGPFDGAVRFSLHNDNVPFSASRIAGYQILDFSFTLFDPTGTELPNGALPASFDLTHFATRSVTARFAFGANGSTRLKLSVDLPAAAAVPEPANWALLIAGFGMIGGVLRRDRKLRLDTTA